MKVPREMLVQQTARALYEHDQEQRKKSLRVPWHIARSDAVELYTARAAVAWDTIRPMLQEMISAAWKKERA